MADEEGRDLARARAGARVRARVRVRVRVGVKARVSGRQPMSNLAEQPLTRTRRRLGHAWALARHHLRLDVHRLVPVPRHLVLVRVGLWLELGIGIGVG